MKLPPEVDKRIRDSLADLDDRAGVLAREEGRGGFLPKFHTNPFNAIKTEMLLLLDLLGGGKNTYLYKIASDIRSLRENGTSVLDDGKIINEEHPATKLSGIINGIRNSYLAGMLESLGELIEANIAADYLGQAEQLLKEGQPGQYDHVPAAVLTGAILENALRTLCSRQSPAIPTVKPNGEPKTMNTLIDDLKKVSVFNELKAKQLRAWADIRNAAAHGEFGKFTRQDVEPMIPSVQNFLADYL